VARARVRQPLPDDGFEPLPPEPETVVARASVGAPGQGGRHARPGLSGLPRRLQIAPGGLRSRALGIIVALALLIGGGGVVGGASFFDSVEISQDLTFPATTKILYSDGSELARLGESTRYELPYERIEENIKIAIVASEDETFWTNDGIDFNGVMRAAWNNFSGGYTQGASTITQQYARLAFDLEGVTYQRKMREAVLAWKMTKAMSKEQILGAYLNAVEFGRQAHGVEAAAKAFFGKDRTVDNTAAPEKQLTLAEAMVMVAMVKQPYPNPDDPEGQPGYDPTNPAAEGNAHSRFDYVKGQLQSTGKITAEEAAQLTFPDTVQPYVEESNGMEGPGGLIVNQVLSELTHNPHSPFYQAKDWTFIKQGGYQIYTTINPGVQAAAIKAVGDGMAGQPAEYQPALVAVEPGTGRVLAYYGGDNGVGLDYAGTYLDENDDPRGSAHPAGSSFKIYTLAAALKANYSLNSYWNWQPHDMGYRTAKNGNQVRNAANCGDLAKDDPTPCSLLQSTISSLNVPYYAVTMSVGAVNVLSMAHAAGIDEIWTNDGERIDLKTVNDMGTVVPEKIYNEVGIGQYPVTVLDHATGVATLAAGGLRADHHFVEKVTKGDSLVYGETIITGAERILSPQQINDETYALSQVAAAKLNIGWDTAGKTGTWEYKDHVNNAHAWMIGFSRTLAAAVWLGNKGDEAPLYNKGVKGSLIYGSGVPATIWKSFMTNATAALNLPKKNTKFNSPNFVGNTNPDGSVPSPGPTGRGGGDGPGGPNLPGFPSQSPPARLNQ
jgi:membrane peptidoglycan carboxypeptidase